MRQILPLYYSNRMLYLLMKRARKAVKIGKTSDVLISTKYELNNNYTLPSTRNVQISISMKKNFTGSWCWFRYNELKMNRQQHVLLYWMLYRNSSAQQMYVDEIFWHDNMWDILSYRYMHEIMNINPCLYDLYLIQMLQKHSFCIIVWNGRPDNMGSFKQYPKKICVCTSESQTNIFIQKLIYRNLKAFRLTLKKRNLAYPYSKIEHSLCNNRTPLFFCA